MADSTTHATESRPAVDPISEESHAALAPFGVELAPLDPLGFAVRGLDLTHDERPHPKLVEVLEREMARRGFLVFNRHGGSAPIRPSTVPIGTNSTTTTTICGP